MHTLVHAAADAVRIDLAGVASGAVSTTQFVSDESKLQAAINLVQRDLGLGLEHSDCRWVTRVKSQRRRNGYRILTPVPGGALGSGGVSLPPGSNRNGGYSSRIRST